MASNTQQTDSIDRVYAKALFEMTEQDGQTADIREELAELKGLIQSQPQLARLIDSQVIRTESLAQAIETIFKGRVSDLLYRFLQVLNRKGRFAALPGVIEAFDKLVDQKHGRVKVDAYVAIGLDDQQAQQVAQGVGKAIGREVTLIQHVDPTLIGGLKLRVGDKLIDGSAATQLRMLRQRIIDQGREKARAAAAQPA